MEVGLCAFGFRGRCHGGFTPYDNILNIDHQAMDLLCYLLTVTVGSGRRTPSELPCYPDYVSHLRTA